jgi:uncharacterized membrane protein
MSRLPYSEAENRPFYAAAFKHIQSLGRRGCHRSALEVRVHMCMQARMFVRVRAYCLFFTVYVRERVRVYLYTDFYAYVCLCVGGWVGRWVCGCAGG